MTDPSDIHIGLRLLRDDGGEPAVSNVTLIHNPTYVWPNNYILDQDKYGFLSAAGPEYIMTDASDPDDHSVLVSAGPFDLGPDEEQFVAFAIMGGADLYALLQNADAAQLTHEQGKQDVGDEVHALPTGTRLMLCAPNPFARATVIRFDLAKSSDVDLGVYDVSGRLLRTLARGHHEAMRYAVSWNGREESGRNVTAGVYFLRLTAGERQQTTRMLRIR